VGDSFQSQASTAPIKNGPQHCFSGGLSLFLERSPLYPKTLVYSSYATVQKECLGFHCGFPLSWGLFSSRPYLFLTNPFLIFSYSPPRLDILFPLCGSFGVLTQPKDPLLIGTASCISPALVSCGFFFLSSVILEEVTIRVPKAVAPPLHDPVFFLVIFFSFRLCKGFSGRLSL